MNLRDLVEANSRALPDVSKLSWEELRQLILIWVIHATAEAVEEDIEEGEQINTEGLIDRTTNTAFAFAEELSKEFGRLSSDEVKRDFKRLYPKLFNQVAKKEKD